MEKGHEHENGRVASPESIQPFALLQIRKGFP